MGKGKTTAIINYVNENLRADKNKRFIIVTPYLDEIEERLSKETGLSYPIADENISKSKDILNYLQKGKSVICTHSLLSRFSDIHRQYITQYGYDLIIDELPDNLITNMTSRNSYAVNNGTSGNFYEKISKSDIAILQSDNKINIDSNDLNKVSWLDDDYDTGIFLTFANTLKVKDVYLYGDKQLIAFMKFDIWQCFDNVTICTYRFKNTLGELYFKAYDVEPDMYHIENIDDKSVFVKGYKLEYPIGLERLILYEARQLKSKNRISKTNYNNFNDNDDKITLSKSFFDIAINGNDKKSNKNRKALNKLKKQSGNYVNSFLGIKKLKDSKSIMWTTFKDYKNKLTNRYLHEFIENKDTGSYVDLFVSNNARATNKYSDRTAVLYLCEINMDSNIANFLSAMFKSKGVDINLTELKDDFTLSCFLQYLWRSNIRKVKSTLKINVYLPSPRIRKLFKVWLMEGLQKINNHEQANA